MLICGPDAAGQRSQPDLDCGHLGGSVLPPCPGPSGMVSGIPGLHPPNARTSPPPPSCDNQKCLQKLLDVPGDGGHSTQPRTRALSVGRHGSPSSLPPVRGLAPSPCPGDRPGPLLGPRTCSPCSPSSQCHPPSCRQRPPTPARKPRTVPPRARLSVRAAETRHLDLVEGSGELVGCTWRSKFLRRSKEVRKQVIRGLLPSVCAGRSLSHEAGDRDEEAPGSRKLQGPLGFSRVIASFLSIFLEGTEHLELLLRPHVGAPRHPCWVASVEAVLLGAWGPGGGRPQSDPSPAASSRTRTPRSPPRTGWSLTHVEDRPVVTGGGV